MTGEQVQLVQGYENAFNRVTHMPLKKHAAFLWFGVLAAGPGLATGPRQNIAKRYPRQMCYRFLLQPLHTTGSAEQYGATLIRMH